MVMVMAIQMEKRVTAIIHNLKRRLTNRSKANFRIVMAGFGSNKVVKNITILLSGTLFSQILPILFFPILSRLYSPSDYGTLGIFMSITLLVSTISNLQLSNAILLPKSDSEGRRIFSLGVYVVVAFTVASMVFVLTFRDMIASYLNSPDLRGWLLILPIASFFSAINVQFSSWFTRIDRFLVISKTRVLTSISTVLLSFLFYFTKIGAGALILSYSIGQGIAFLVFLSAFIFNYQFHYLSLSEIRILLKDNRNFALYTAPTELINNFSQQLPIYLFSLYAGVQSVGWFSRSRQILALPISYLSNSISEIYKQKFSEIFRTEPLKMRPYFIKAVLYLFALSCVPFMIVAIFAPDLFAFFFGEPWRMAGVYARIMVVMYFFKFVVSPTTFNFYLAGKQRLDFLLHLLLIFLTFASLLVGLYVYHDDQLGLLLFSVSYASVYLIYGFFSYRFAVNKV